MVCPKCSKTGFTFSKTAFLPAAMIQSLASTDSFLLPKTGASRKSTPPFAYASCSRKLVAGTTVLMSTAICPSLIRSEEHTSELQSHSDIVCRLLLEKEKREGPQRRRTRKGRPSCCVTRRRRM